MQLGIDMSHHNDIEYAGMGYDFIFIKATEGRTYKDPALDKILEKIAQLRKDSLPVIGFYHYARPENGNTAEQEADNLLKSVKNHIGSCHLALDFEGNALTYKNMKYRAEWINSFLEYVRKNSGVKPWMYMSDYEYRILDSKITVPHKYWIAHYATAETVLTPEEPYIHQYCSAPIDTNIYTGTRAQLSSLT